MRRSRSFRGVLAVAAIASATWVASVPAASSAPGLPKVTICHRTNSVTNPYVQITVDEDAVDGNTLNDNGQGDHTTHAGPVFDATNPPPPPHNGDQWGDIIPPFDENGDPRPVGTPTLNWPAGQDIFENGCKPTVPVEVGNVAVHKTVVNPDAVAVPSSFSIELVCTTDGGATTVLDEVLSLAGDATSGSFEVPAGASCGATEDSSGIANLVSVTTDGPVTIAAEADALVTVTNTFAGTPTPGGTAVPSTPNPAPVASVAPAAVQVTPRTTG